MKKIIIIIPVFNDWESLEKLILEIDKIIYKLKNVTIECLIINDASTKNQPQFKRPKNFKDIKILNMKKNQGHARCNAFGIRYVFNNKKFDFLILMDGDGEDRPEEIIDLVDKIQLNPEASVVAKRVKRSEGFFFKFLYLMHKILTLIFTGKKVNFGNYSCLTKKDVEKIHSEASLWSSYSGTVIKNISNFNKINSIRGKRFFGPSKMSFFNLVIHSLSIIAVFKYDVFLRSSIFFIVLIILPIISSQITMILQIALIFFNLIIFLISFREKKDELLLSQENLKDIKDFTH